MTKEKETRSRSEQLRISTRAEADTRPQIAAARPASTIPAPQRASERPPLSVDEVGMAAVRLAARLPRSAVPKRTRSKRAEVLAGLDEGERALFGLVDGERCVGDIVEATGDTAARVAVRLLRLERLGVITF